MENRFNRRDWLAGAVAAAAQIAAPLRGAESADPLSWSIREAAAALAKGSISSEELTKLCLARIDALDRKLNAFITLDSDAALQQARECDRERRAGRARTPLHGIPIALKDNIDT